MTNREHGSPAFYELINQMADLHEAKSHDYAKDSDPSGNYHFAGYVASLFAHSPDDAGFAGRLAEKIFRLSVLEGGQLQPKNESVADTDLDIAVIAALWMADRRTRRLQANRNAVQRFTEDSREIRDEFVNLAGKMHPNDLRMIYEYVGQLMAVRST